MTAKQPRLSVEPVRAMVAQAGGVRLMLDELGNGDDYTYTTRSVRRWFAAGSISIKTADTFATSAGLHPCELWPEWWSL